MHKFTNTLVDLNKLIRFPNLMSLNKVHFDRSFIWIFKKKVTMTTPLLVCLILPNYIIRISALSITHTLSILHETSLNLRR